MTDKQIIFEEFAKTLEIKFEFATDPELIEMDTEDKPANCPECEKPMERAGNTWRCWECKKLYFACQTCGCPLKELPCAICMPFVMQLGEGQ